MEGIEPVAWAGRRAVVAFPERVDRSNVVQVRDELLAVFDRGAVVVIADMSATAWCDGAGVDAVAWAYQRAAVRRAELRLVATAPAVRQLLAAEGLDRLVPVYSSMEAAVAAGEPVDPDPPGDPALSGGGLAVVVVAAGRPGERAGACAAERGGAAAVD